MTYLSEKKVFHKESFRANKKKSFVKLLITFTVKYVGYFKLRFLWQ